MRLSPYGGNNLYCSVEKDILLYFTTAAMFAMALITKKDIKDKHVMTSPL